TGLDRPTWIAAVDVDGDGDRDLALVLEHEELAGEDAFTWLENSNGDGETFVRRATVEMIGIQHVTSADMDSDGDLDFVVATGGTEGLIDSPEDDEGAVHWLESVNGGTSFVAHRVGSILTPWQLSVADLTGDGRPDIAVAGSRF